MDTLYKFIEQFVLLVIPVITPFLVAILVVKARQVWIVANEWQPSVTEILAQAAQFAVKAAEQAKVTELITDKKEYALEVAAQYLKLNKINVDIHLLSAAIENAVYQAFNSETKKPAQP